MFDILLNIFECVFFTEYTTPGMVKADPLTIAMATASLAQIGMGIRDRYKSRQELNELGDRPAYEIPDEAKESLEVTRNIGSYLAQQGAPEESLRLQRQGAERGAATGIRTLQSRGAGVAGAGMMAQGLADSYTQMASIDAQMRLQNMSRYQQDLSQALNTMAGFREKEIADQQGNWDVAYAEAMGRREAGSNQIMAGMQSGINAMGADLTDPKKHGAGAGDGVGGQSEMQYNLGAGGGSFQPGYRNSFQVPGVYSNTYGVFGRPFDSRNPKGTGMDFSNVTLNPGG